MKQIEKDLAQLRLMNQDDPDVLATAKELLALARQRHAEGKLPDEIEGLIAEPLRYRHPAFEYDGERREIVRGEQRFSLTNTESLLFEYLVRRLNTVVPRFELVELIRPDVDSLEARNNINIHLSHIRKYIRDDPSGDPLRTIRGVGYMLVDPSRPMPMLPEAEVALP